MGAEDSMASIHPGIGRERGKERIHRPEGGGGQPDDQPGEHPPDDEDGKEEAPEQEPAPVLLLHGGEDLGIDDGIVDARDGLKEAEAGHDQDA